ncbi:hypothetical protein [Marinilabilia salmonicolor]|jgi:hypothetical protein|uniref:Uncharacterized protein n=1 Tax=Marinilabilia salmonicolor TaxID=989 RepID=A0A368UIX4_9BACT|nr:hypothetical protein [Marinilabilia salmonicolor]RCW23130.1 hypothetical protein DFO77_1496 [Marinilabilia salmonicolor]
MTTEQKIDKIIEFLSRDDNKLIWSQTETLQAGTFFDIELSVNNKDIDFSVSIPANNLDDAVSILKEVTINKDLQQIRKELNNRIDLIGIKSTDRFYILVKGNKDKRVENE